MPDAAKLNRLIAVLKEMLRHVEDAATPERALGAGFVRALAHEADELIKQTVWVRCPPNCSILQRQEYYGDDGSLTAVMCFARTPYGETSQMPMDVASAFGHGPILPADSDLRGEDEIIRLVRQDFVNRYQEAVRAWLWLAEQALEAQRVAGEPPAPWERLSVDLEAGETGTATLDGRSYALPSQAAAAMLHHLLRADGGWVSGKWMACEERGALQVTRPDRTRKAIKKNSPELAELIVPGGSRGYRLNL